METPGASDLKAYPTCKICDRGTLMPRKIRRLSGPAVAIGYILLIPSILGMVACAILFIVSLLATFTSAAHGSAFATAFAGTWSIAVVSAGVTCFIFGLVGWLLIMKKHVLQCVYCGAVVDAAVPVYSPPSRNMVSARNFVLGVVIVLGITGAIWAFILAEVGTQTSAPTAMDGEPAQPAPDNSPAAPAKSDTWLPFTSTAGHFSILFPATPQQLKEPGSHVRGFSSSVDKDHTVYGVEYTDLRPGIGPEAVPQAILGAEEKIGIGKGMLVMDKIIDLHGVPGRAFEIVGPSGDTGLVREFFTWPYLYTVMVVARKGNTAPHAAKFLNSFRILDNPPQP